MTKKGIQVYSYHQIDIECDNFKDHELRCALQKEEDYIDFQNLILTQFVNTLCPASKRIYLERFISHFLFTGVEIRKKG